MTRKTVEGTVDDVKDPAFGMRRCLLTGCVFRVRDLESSLCGSF